MCLAHQVSRCPQEDPSHCFRFESLSLGPNDAGGSIIVSDELEVVACIVSGGGVINTIRRKCITVTFHEQELANILEAALATVAHATCFFASSSSSELT